MIIRIIVILNKLKKKIYKYIKNLEDSYYLYMFFEYEF